MTMTTTHIRRMLTEMQQAGLSIDEIARRARLSRGSVFRFVQGDAKVLRDDLDKVVGLYALVIGKQPPAAL